MRICRVILLSVCYGLGTLPAQVILNPIASRVIGQDSIAVTSFAPNLVEGRELFGPQAVALDMSSGGAGALYIADTANNRILAYRSAAGFSNGQKADFVLGQPNLATTFAQGPGRTSRSTGLASPTGLAVDSTGNLYVVDSANNRILRFPKPVAQTGDQLPDLVIGQPGFTTAGANQGGISASTFSFTTSAGVVSAGMAFDSTGNLWVTDAANNRVLRFNANSLGSGAGNGPAADIVLGQSNFTSTTAETVPTSLTTLNIPSSVVFDSAGRMFVSESSAAQPGRVLVWAPPFSTGKAALRMLGVDQSTPPPSAISEYQFGVSTGALFSLGDHVGIADNVNNRLLIFLPVEQWNQNNFYQGAVTVVGQNDFVSGLPNEGLAFPGPSTLGHPAGAVFSGTELYVADGGNNRVIVMPVSGSGFGPATRVAGQDGMDLNTANLIEGREFDFSAPGNTGGDAGIAVDLKGATPHLYIADPYNNRILGYNDLRNIQPGQKADLVIGQPDFQHSLANYPANDVNKPTASSLFLPVGVVVDANGDLYVADTGNGRVLRFPAPFSNYSPGTMMAANLVLGQINFTSKITDATSRTLAAPYGIALSTGGLLVSDTAQNRVLFFPGTSQTFVNGEPATVAFGQPDMNSSAAGAGLNQLRGPRHIAIDSDDRLYVADAGNHRVSIFDRVSLSTTGTYAAQVLTAGLNTPRGVYVSQATGDIWVTDPSANAAVRYPPFNLLAATNFASNATLSEIAPLAVAEDAWGNVFIADDANRVVIHYPGLAALNAANQLDASNPVAPAPMAPGLIATLYSASADPLLFGGQGSSATSVPLPKQLNGLQVVVNGTPAPLFYAGPGQINFQVPWNAPQTGSAEIRVMEVATGRIIGSVQAVFYSVSPGVFTQSGNGIGAAVAVNQDGTLNTATNPEIQGNVLTLYCTGEGLVNGAPADGDIPNKAVPTAVDPLVVFTPGITGTVQYSGLAPTLVGVWQINVQIPLQVITQPTVPTQILVIQNSLVSGGGGAGRAVLVYVKKRP